MKRVAIILFLLVLSGCGQGPQRDYSLTGSDGILLDILDVPSYVFENEQFPITLELENVGIHSVTPENPGTYDLSYDKLYIQEVDSVSRFNPGQFWLEGRNLWQDGESTYVTFYFLANPIQRYSQDIRTPILFTACYPYQSDISAQVCIEQLRIADAGSVVCRNTPIHPATPGAPVGVSEIEVRTLRVPEEEGGGVQPTFRITVKNLGRGIPSALPMCGDEEDGKLLNSVLLSAYLLDEPLDCGVQPLKLTRGESMATCRLPDGSALTRGEGNFLSLLNIYLDYTYRESVKAEVMVTR